MDNKKISVIVTLNQKIISVNALYGVKMIWKNGHPYPQRYKVKAAKDMESEFRDQLRSLDLSNHIDWIKNCKEGFDLNIKFVFKNNILKRDCSNACKCVEDCWVNFIREDLGIDNYDDSKHIRVILSKSILPKSSHEYVCLQLTPTTANMRFDAIDRPDMIKVSPDISEKEKKAWKKKLKDNGLKVKIVDPEESKYNTDIITLLPERIDDPRYIVDLVNTVYSRLDNGYLIVGLDESNLFWDEEKKKKGKDLLSYLKQQINNRSNIILDCIKDKSEYLNIIININKYL